MPFLQNNYTLQQFYKNKMASNTMILALRAVSENRGITGKTLGMLGICDMVEEYLGVDREKFVKEIVKTNVILDAAIEMWHKKNRKTSKMHYNDHAVSYDEMNAHDLYYIEMFDLYGEGFVKHNNKFIMDYIGYKSVWIDDDDDYMQHQEDEYDAYMNEPYGSHEDDYDYRSD